MCYAIPGKVLKIIDNKLVVDYFGEEHHYINEISNIKIGDYVYAQGGFIIQKVPPAKAKSVLEAWEELFFKLKDIDKRLAIPKTSLDGTKQDFKTIIEKVKQGKAIDKSEALKLIKTENETERKVLYETANQVRERSHGNACCVHGIIEFSNYCQNHCSYCGLNCDNKKVTRYRMDVKQIVEVATYAGNNLGFKAMVLQSGEDPWYTTDKVVEIITEIKRRIPVLLFISIGNRSEAEYEAFYKAGARAALYRFETSNPSLYSKVCAPGGYENRVLTLKALKRIGYLIATGSLVGLPDQTDDDLINDILMAKESYAEMYSSGPFIPHPDTKLAKAPKMSLNKMLNYLAVNRLLDFNGNILATTAVQTLDKEEGAKKALLAGANSLMVNLTPLEYKESYDIYPQRYTVNQCIAEQINYVLDLMYSLGRAPTDLGVI